MSKTPSRKRSRVARAIRRNSGLLLFVLGMMFFRTAVADWSYVPTGSMEPTVYGGDWLLVDKTAFGPTIPFTSVRLWTVGHPQRGDIITFYPPHDEDLYVKRVIGVPGDRIVVQGADVYVNGELLVLDQIETADDALIGLEHIGDVEHRVQYSRNRPVSSRRLEYLVPPGKYFVMGDHRNNSEDSRYWGYVDEHEVTGKVTHIAVSFSKRRPALARFAIPID